MRNLVICAVIFGVLINLILPQILKPFATENEIKPPDGAENLTFKEQLMHMFVHHAQVPISSSIIVVVIVTLALILAQNY